MLVDIAEAQSTFDGSGEAQVDGSYKINGRANITTFSDSIVVSYPLLVRPDSVPPELRLVIRNGWEGMVRGQMYEIAAQVAKAGLDLGLLMRCGLSRGKLYHYGTVVMGEAMIDAYLLERDVADGSRVVVSDRITDDNRLYVDHDGRKYLDFLRPLMELADDRHGDARAWAGRKLMMIDETIAGLEEQGSAKPALKWRKFRQQLAAISNAWPGV